MKMTYAPAMSTDPNDQELMDALKQQRAQREAALAPIQAAQSSPDLGGALAGMAGGFADVLGKGRTNYAGQAIAANKSAEDDALSTRLKALDEKDATLKPLVDLAKLRMSERGLDKRQTYAEQAQQRQLDAAQLRAETLGGNRGQSLDLRIAKQGGAAASEFDHDKILTALTQQQQQIGRDKHTLDSATTLTPQIFNEIQTGIANAIAGGHSAAQGTIHDLKYQSAAIDLEGLKQRLTNRPQDIGSPEVKKYLSDLIGRLGEAYAGNISDRAQQLAVGKNYEKFPTIQKAIQDKLATYARPATVPSAVGPHGATVYQKGHMFSWNPESGAYE